MKFQRKPPKHYRFNQMIRHFIRRLAQRNFHQLQQQHCRREHLYRQLIVLIHLRICIPTHHMQVLVIQVLQAIQELAITIHRIIRLTTAVQLRMQQIQLLIIHIHRLQLHLIISPNSFRHTDSTTIRCPIHMLHPLLIKFHQLQFHHKFHLQLHRRTTVNGIITKIHAGK